MTTLKQIFENVWFAAGRISKKAYKTGFIVFSGAVAVAVMLIGVNGFTSSPSIARVSTYEVEEEDGSKLAEKELMTEEVAEEESLPYYVTWAIANYEAEQAEMNSEAMVSLTKEPDTDKDLKTSGNISSFEEPILTAKDYTALLRIVEAEATSEDLTGKILIANVVMNRVNSKRFPSSIYDVVFQSLDGRAQFSPIDDGRYYSVAITKSTEKAVAAALKGTDYSEGALFFVAKSLASENAGSWFDRNLTFVMKHGVHSFYKY